MRNWEISGGHSTQVHVTVAVRRQAKFYVPHSLGDGIFTFSRDAIPHVIKRMYEADLTHDYPHILSQVSCRHPG